MKLSRKVLISLGVVFATALVGGCVAIALSESIGEEDLIDIDDINGDDLMTYYDDKAKDTDQFDVTDVLLRRDGNFL